MRRTWVKLWVDQCLRGTLKDELSNEERWTFIGLILLAGDSPVPGIIQAATGTGYSDKQLAKMLDVPIHIFIHAKAKMQIPWADQKNPKILVDENNIITITGWPKYQSDYDRQKPYRQGTKGTKPRLQRKVTSKGYKRRLQADTNPRLQPEVTPKGYTLEGEGEGDIEGDEERDRDTPRPPTPHSDDRIAALKHKAREITGEPKWTDEHPSLIDHAITKFGFDHVNMAIKDLEMAVLDSKNPPEHPGRLLNFYLFGSNKTDKNLTSQHPKKSQHPHNPDDDPNSPDYQHQPEPD